MVGKPKPKPPKAKKQTKTKPKPKPKSTDRETSAHETDLLAAVYAAPFDDGPREIYANWLLERGDPRGEFITLQLASEKRRLSATKTAREEELLATHRRAWLGPLAAIEVRFSRGFPYSFHWRDKKLPDDPRWSTAEICERMPPTSGLRALRRLTRAKSEDLARLGELPADSPLEHIEWNCTGPGKARDAAIAAYRKARLPSLQTLTIHADFDKAWDPDRIGWVFEGRALTEVEVPGDPRHLAAYIELFEKHAPALKTLTIGTLDVCITRIDGRLQVFMLVVGTNAIEAALAGLEQLAPNVLDIVKVSTKSKAPRIRDRFAAAIARHEGCTFVYTTITL